MRSFTFDQLSASGPAAAAPPAFLRVQEAYALALSGLHTRGQIRMGGALDELEETDPTGLFHARALLLCGLMERSEGRLEPASQRLGAAVRRFVQANEAPWADLSAALAVEALCALGRLDQARSLLERWAKGAPDVPSLSPHVGSGVFQLAKGNLEEARQLFDKALAVVAPPLPETWARLWFIETQVELGRAAAVEEPLRTCLRQLNETGRRDELFLRALVLQARLTIDGLAAAFSEPQPYLDALQELLPILFDYAVSAPRYRATAMVLDAHRLALVSPARAEGRFQEGIELLRERDLRLDEGRAIAQYARFRHALAMAPCRTLVARGRDVLTRIGADARSQALARVEAGGVGMEAGHSVLATRSMVGQSLMLGAAPGDEDVELQAVFEVNRAISSVLELEELLGRILVEVVRVLKAERAALLQWDSNGQLRCAAAHGLDPARALEGELSLGLVDEVRRTGEVMLTDNAQVDERLKDRASVLASEIRSMMCAPLKTPSGLQGVLYVDSTMKGRIFTSSHRDLFQVFATQAAVAVENAGAFARIAELNRTLEAKVEERTTELVAANAELSRTLEVVTTTQLRLAEAQRDSLEKEMRIARDIQERLVPARGIIQRPGVRFLGRVDPSSLVGGDFWTYLSLPGGCTLLFIGDVTGHGVGAGMITTVAHSCCVTLIRTLGTVDVRTLLTTLSDVIFESAKGALQMTGCVCLVDPVRQELSVAGAGHPPPLLIEFAEGLRSVRPLPMRGSVLGAEGPKQFQVLTVPYTPQDRLFLFTDGLLECTNANQKAFGMRLLKRALVANADQPLEAHFEAVVRASCEHFAQAPRADDVSYLMCEFEIAGPPAKTLV